MQIQAKSNNRVEILLYEDIGGWFGITADEFVREVKSAAKDKTDIDLRINSNGGNVFDGVAIYNYLRSAPQKVTVHIDGIAASIASIIAMAGDTINMADNAWMMIHDPWIVAMGTATELRDVAETMDGIRDTLLDTYMKRATKERKEISDMMAAETWLKAPDALAAGLADEVTGTMDVAASIHKDWFKNPPQNLAKDAPRPRRDFADKAFDRMALALRRISTTH